MISKENLRKILSDQRANILRKELGIEREALQIIGEKRNLPHVHVITGIRRCGKSTLLRQVISRFYNDEDFYYINFEDERLIGFQAGEFNLIYETLIELFGEKKAFFIDEIQHVINFDAFVRRFYDNGFKFYITGSNAGLLNEEISSRLTGRHMDTLLKPFSFKEFIKFKTGSSGTLNHLITEERAMLTRLFNEYLIKGGMPEYLKYDESEILFNIYNDILTKDIFIRKNLTNSLYVRELYQFLIGSFAQKFSYNSLLRVSPVNSVNSIKKYIGLLAESYFITIVNKYSHSIRKQLANDKKIYIIDNGFIPVLSTRQGKDQGWLLENLVSNSINGTNYLYYFNEIKECDFIVLKNKEFIAAIQVCFELNHSNYKRETEGLNEAMEFAGLKKGYMLTFDQEDKIILGDKEMIVKPVWQWLLEEPAEQ